MKREMRVSKDVPGRQPATTGKAELREDPSNIKESNENSHPNKDADHHQYPKDERRWPENKVPAK